MSNRSYDVQSKIRMLLAECPEAARIVDAGGRLPVNILLESGIAWDEGIQDLIASEPEVNGNRDCVTSLYPFVLGAVGANRRQTVITEAAETQECQLAHSLSTIYTFLRADPAIAFLTTIE